MVTNNSRFRCVEEVAVERRCLMSTSAIAMSLGVGKFRC